MFLIAVWGGVLAYFLLLLYAVGLEMAVGGSILFVWLAARVTVMAAFHIWKTRRQTRLAPPEVLPDPSLPANLNQPPGRKARR